MTTNDGMKELISLVNRLQDAASVAGLSLGKLDLPQIAVVGGQSAGKSSVLENFVGRDFLPRGSGIVTRRPLVLQLHQNAEEYAEFLHLPGKKYSDFIEVRKEIENETDRETGSNKGISNRPINLRVYSPHVLDLTVVDLPGITKVPVGDQPADIEIQIRHMILEYIKLDSTLILAVSPANQDLANSDALKLAMEVDPEGLRTIGVITKLDLMDRGTDAKDILENRLLPLRRGYVGLVNRSQQDIDTGKDIRAAQAAELDYFLSSEPYRHMADRMGTKFLQQVLNQQLAEHIRDRMPLLKSNIKKQHQDVKAELVAMKAFEEGTDTWRQTMLIKMVEEFSEQFTVEIRGHSVKISGEELSAGARINACYYSQVQALLDQSAAFDEAQLRIIIANIPGIYHGLFPPGLSFHVAVTQIIQRYRESVSQAVDLISDIITNSAMKLVKNKFQDFPRLKEVIIALITAIIKQYEDKTKKHLRLHLDAHCAFMNAKHPEFQRITNVSQIPPDERLGRRPKDLKNDGSNQSMMYRADSVDSLTSLAAGIDEEDASSVAKSHHQPQKPTIVHKGWILIHGVVKKSKEHWVVLTTSEFELFREEDERDLVGSFPLEDLSLQKSKNGKYILQRNGKSIMGENNKEAAFSFKAEKDEDIWKLAFSKVGIDIGYKSTRDSSSRKSWLQPQARSPALPPSQPKMTLNSPTLIQSVTSNPEITDGADMILNMVHSYMKIIDKCIHDMVPKYITLLLVNQTVEFCTKMLLGEIIKDENWQKLIEESSEEVAKRKKLFAVYDATKKALEIMDVVTASG